MKYYKEHKIMLVKDILNWIDYYSLFCEYTIYCKVITF